MPYNPGIDFRGDQYLFRGLSNLGAGVAGGIEEWQKKHDELARELGQSDVIVSHALKTGRISPEEYTKYVAGSATQKGSIAAGIAKNIAQDQAIQSQQQEQQYKYDALANAIKVAQIHAAAVGGAEGFSPAMEQAAQQAAQVAGKQFVRTSKGGGQLVDMPEAAVDPTKTRAVEIPGSGGLKVVVDEKGNLVKNTQIQGAVRPNPIADMLASGMFGGGTANPAFNVAPQTAPIAPQVAAGVAPQVDAQAALAQARAKIQAGANPDAVKARLKQLGVDPSGL